MTIELKRNCLLIVPENDHDRAFIEDTLKLKNDKDSVILRRINNVSLGFAEGDKYVLKSEMSS